MLNILLGVGLSGLYMTIKAGNKRQDRHPDRPLKYKPYQLEISRTLVVSGATLLLTLVGLLIFVPANRWVMDKKIGWAVIALWSLSTIINVALEMAGMS